jgi:FkbM family methyltransferase
MSRHPYGKQAVLDELSRSLDEIEKSWPMTGSYQRIDPYIVPLMQANQRFELIVYHIESKLWFDKSWCDYPQLEVLNRGFIRPGSVAFDLGCNSGSITLPMASQVGPTGHVHAFDPYPWNAAATRASAKLNRLTNVTAHAVGLSNRTHSIRVAANDSRIYAESAAESAQALDIRHIGEYMHLRPSFLKIDIEGAEHELFDSDDTRLYDGVEWVFLEYHPMWLVPRGVDCRVPLRNMRKHGFEVHFYSPDAPPFDIESYAPNQYRFWLSRPPLRPLP